MLHMQNQLWAELLGNAGAAAEVSMSCEKSDNTQTSTEPLALDTAHLVLRKITEMDSHSAFSRRVGINKGKYRASNLSSLQN